MMEFDIPTIVQGYRQGYFLMANANDRQVDWYTSRQRTLMPLDERFRYPRSLRRMLNQNRFSVGINRDFAGVVEGCANRDNTWISPELKAIYMALHQTGWAHSFETWQGDQLAGGILGIAIGCVFIGETMFYRIPNGSKVAMVKLVEHLRSRHFAVFDVQLMNPHLERFGAYNIPDKDYQQLRSQAVQGGCLFS